MLGPHDLGHRVVVRRIVGERAGRPVLSDALGTLTDITDTSLSVATDTAELHIDRRAVVAAKRIPPRPPRRSPRRPPEV
ncbi:hypothetical protein JQS43_04645 [Natronosporangium hydrolyticum]|uniref:Ferrous iron transport protein A n=1 Tax=Natronosporangium hydrolyticum TaxID=2811111 RepID=A0A895YDK9_9ACTN|nr:hypothetical protein [Natronosporangium hydrolyticum]QSB15641.1 hypothetical protein JQS43_04645 [Natronosporangium hydrolyticum]